MNKRLLGVLSSLLISLSVFAQDQTVNGDLYIGQGYHDQLGYGKQINFLGNSDPCFITRYNVAGNITEFRFSMGDDLYDDKFVVGVTTGDGQWHAKLTVRGDGSVGIGTNQPGAKLDVDGGDIKASGNLIVSAGNATGGGIKLADDGDIVDMNDGWATHRFSYGLRVTNGNSTGSPVIQLANGGGGNSTFFNAGNVLIGKTSQANNNYKLDVAGSVRANEIIVNSTGADFVFDDAYKLRRLDNLNSFIKKYRHLPEIPSASQMQSEGMEVGELNKKLLQKVEELTLYLIEKEQQFQKQQVINQKQTKALNELRQSVNILKRRK